MNPQPTKVSVQRLLRHLEQLPAHPNVAMRVVLETNDPRSSAARLGRLIEIDPSLTAHVMRLANSAFYGLSTRVSSAARAVAVLGFSMVRSMAAGIATGVLDPDSGALPAGFWEHSVATAVAASLLAPRVGCSGSDAFSLGLLHDVGAALLYRLHPEAYEMVVNRAIAGGVPLVHAEHEAFGTSHDVAAGRVFAAWKFPPDLVRAIGNHHQPVRSQPASPLSALLAAAEELAHWLPDAPRGEPYRPDALAAIGVAHEELAALVEQMVERTADVAASVAPVLAMRA
jgi:putative nucleotidyltransferase with HDIG domain